MNVPVRNALVIPQQATYEVQDQKYVFVADARGYVHSRPIKVSYEEQNVFVLSSGLSVNDKILIDGIDKLKDGDRISCRYKSPAAVLNSIKLKAN
jgi:membrane fusion protein (multidrug efflux system)